MRSLTGRKYCCIAEVAVKIQQKTARLLPFVMYFDIWTCARARFVKPSFRQWPRVNNFYRINHSDENLYFFLALCLLFFVRP